MKDASWQIALARRLSRNGRGKKKNEMERKGNKVKNRKKLGHGSKRTWLSGDIKPRTYRLLRQSFPLIFKLKDWDHRWPKCMR